MKKEVVNNKESNEQESFFKRNKITIYLSIFTIALAVFGLLNFFRERDYIVDDIYLVLISLFTIIILVSLFTSNFFLKRPVVKPFYFLFVTFMFILLFQSIILSFSIAIALPLVFLSIIGVVVSYVKNKSSWIGFWGEFLKPTKIKVIAVLVFAFYYLFYAISLLYLSKEKFLGVSLFSGITVISSMLSWFFLQVILSQSYLEMFFACYIVCVPINVFGYLIVFIFDIVVLYIILCILISLYHKIKNFSS